MTAKCYSCKFRAQLTFTHHSQCVNTTATVERNAHGVRNGWCAWPFNFDPIWIESCGGYQERAESDPEPKASSDPLMQLLSILGGR